jgi:hypothetical protein
VPLQRGNGAELGDDSRSGTNQKALLVGALLFV